MLHVMLGKGDFSFDEVARIPFGEVTLRYVTLVGLVLFFFQPSFLFEDFFTEVKFHS
jgi:hypothetical protein